MLHLKTLQKKSQFWGGIWKENHPIHPNSVCCRNIWEIWLTQDIPVQAFEANSLGWHWETFFRSLPPQRKTGKTGSADGIFAPFETSLQSFWWIDCRAMGWKPLLFSFGDHLNLPYQEYQYSFHQYLRLSVFSFVALFFKKHNASFTSEVFVKGVVGNNYKGQGCELCRPDTHAFGSIIFKI